MKRRHFIKAISLASAAVVFTKNALAYKGRAISQGG